MRRLQLATALTTPDNAEVAREREERIQRHMERVQREMLEIEERRLMTPRHEKDRGNYWNHRGALPDRP